MHLFLFAASEKSSRAFSKFEIVRMEPRNWEACEKCGGSAQSPLRLSRVRNSYGLDGRKNERTAPGTLSYNWLISHRSFSPHESAVGGDRRHARERKDAWKEEAEGGSGSAGDG